MLFPAELHKPLDVSPSIASFKNLSKQGSSQLYSPSQKVLLYNSGSVSNLFFANKADAVSLSHNKRNFKELL